ncbi:MAG: DGQHR domain-containing protein [Paludibacteraceae bacterium]|nr:DGQHR domain-containing protein [Paludibacteraceae bacterium]
MNLNNYIEVKCLKATQPIGDMYVAVMDSDVLERISYVDVRRIEKGGVEEREVETYMGIQRPLVTSREKEIGKYVNLVDATFPNSIILAISSGDVEYDESTNIIKIRNSQDVAKVLDGQHRIAGLKHFDGEKFQCVVTIYIDMDLEDQAVVFATINKEQKGVNKSLVADLFEFAETRSPQKTCHNVARALNEKEGSPFFGKIKILGVANDSEKETLTQDTFVKSILKYISRDAQADRDVYRRAKHSLFSTPELSYDEKKDSVTLILRKIFIQDESDVEIAQIIWNYFYAVQKVWPRAWNEVRPNYILNKSTGYIALMRFFKDCYLSIGKENPSKEDFVSIFEKISLTDDDFTKETYVPGSSGQSSLYNHLLELSGLK